MRPLLLIAASLFMFQGISYANLSEYKSKGWAKENANGYLDATSSASADVRSKINAINAKRRAKYAELAKKFNKSPAEMGRETAKKLM
jgi:uncharacterized protein YdbL (DUF1318 family)